MVAKNVAVTPGITYDFSEIVGQTITLVSAAANAQSGDGLVEGDVVAKKCTAADTCNDPNVLTQTFQIKDGPFLTGRQWKDVANALQLGLQLQGIKFDKFIIVSD